MSEGGSEDLRQALLDAAARRPLIGGETNDLIEGAASRMADLLRTIDGPQRWTLLDEALARMSTPGASLRKLEKRIRQAAIDAAGSARARAVVELAPEIRIDDLHGTVRFSIADEADIVIDGSTYTVPVAGRLVGGALERSLLTRSAHEFIEEARPALNAQLDLARAETQSAAERIDRIVAERVSRPLYDARGLRRLVLRAIRDAEDMPAALEEIEYRIGPLDQEAGERERVRVLVEERGLIAYRQYFPMARSLKRELVMYAGPTNSGKTWRALNELAASDSGIYLAPLRLLALEGQ
ncbi:MAG: hypothetical protein KFH98_09715, partial [Gemmatimonadetes bacterium]|nr:hypothetical protein [Gemmatimonadota bacterium]